MCHYFEKAHIRKRENYENKTGMRRLSNTAKFIKTPAREPIFTKSRMASDSHVSKTLYPMKMCNGANCYERQHFNKGFQRKLILTITYQNAYRICVFVKGGLSFTICSVMLTLLHFPGKYNRKISLRLDRTQNRLKFKSHGSLMRVNCLSLRYNKVTSILHVVLRKSESSG